jgi:hypothetical protein
MRKPANWHHAIMFDPKLENSISARKLKITRLKNMLATGKPVYCTLANMRLQISHAYGDLVYFITSDCKYPMYSIDKINKLSHFK